MVFQISLVVWFWATDVTQKCVALSTIWRTCLPRIDMVSTCTCWSNFRSCVPTFKLNRLGLAAIWWVFCDHLWSSLARLRFVRWGSGIKRTRSSRGLVLVDYSMCHAQDSCRSTKIFFCHVSCQHNCLIKIANQWTIFASFKYYCSYDIQKHIWHQFFF